MMRRMSVSNLRDPHSRALTRTGTGGNGTSSNSAMHSGFGGFPNPIFAAAEFARARIPTIRSAVERTVTIPRTTTMMSTHSQDSRMGTTTFAGSEHPHVKPVSYISFDAVVGRNSRFHGLSDAQQEELGGVEYRVRFCFSFVSSCCPCLLTLCFVPTGTHSVTPSRRWLLPRRTASLRSPRRSLACSFRNVSTRLRRSRMGGQPYLVRVFSSVECIQ